MKWLVAPIYAFVLFAPAVVVYHSFSDSVVLEFPPAPTLRWYRSLLEQPRLLRGMVASTVVAAVASAVAVATGVPAAYAIHRSARKGLLTALFLSPLVLPGIVLALGILMTLSVAAPALVGTMWPLLAAHVLVTSPWVIRTVSANLELTDPHLEEAARGLGATPLQSFFLVTLPAIRPGLVTGAVFAFIVSFGNFALSLFFASGTVTTLPVAIFEYIDQFQDPTVAAASSLVIFATTAAVLVGSGRRSVKLP